MSRKTNSTKLTDGNSVTIIGPGASINGDIAFAGFLRVQGQITGSITCKHESGGTTVVHGSGNVTGTIKTPTLVVGGRVQGPVQASGSIEIQRGAVLAGDASYRQMVIRRGGVFEGSLIPLASMKGDHSGLDNRLPTSPAALLDELDTPLANDGRPANPYWSGRKLASAAALIAVAVALVWIAQTPTEIEQSAMAAAPQPATPAMDPPIAQSVTQSAAPSSPQQGNEPRLSPPVATIAEAIPSVSDRRLGGVETKAPVPPDVSGPPTGNPAKVLSVQGMDADKPAGAFFVETREAAILIKKARNDPTDGTRIDLPRKTKKRIPITRDEIVRVAQGQNVEMFYQGRKLAPGTIEGGAWIGFVPLAPTGPTAPTAPTAQSGSE